MLSCFLFEYFWARCATNLGPIEATVGLTAFVIPSSFIVDFIIWPDPNQFISNAYLVGTILVMLSFIVVSFAKDETIKSIRKKY